MFAVILSFFCWSVLGKPAQINYGEASNIFMKMRGAKLKQAARKTIHI